LVSQHGLDETTKAKLLLILLALIWGMSWPIMKIALDEVTVWTLRGLGYSISAVSLFALIRLQGRSAAVPYGTPWLHIIAASMFNVVGFGLFSSFAQLTAATSRVVIINYSMPVWASLWAWLVLGERLTPRAWTGLVLCIAGLTVLIYPVATQSFLGLLLAFGCSLCWAGGTIYMKWARIPGDLLTITAWQIVLGAVVFCAGYLIFDGLPTLAPVSLPAAFGVLYNGLLGTGFAYILWFAIIGRLPTATASLGALATPVVGVTSTMLMLGEWPTTADRIGFALIFTAAACVLLPAGRWPAGKPL
jgi:drug/metabolite transporter (DMT)-like permease